MKNTIARKGSKSATEKSKKTTAPKPSTAIIKPFTVTTETEWVEIETTVRADHMAYLEKQSREIREGYGHDVIGFMRKGLVTLRYPAGAEPPEDEKVSRIRKAMGHPLLTDEDFADHKMKRVALKIEARHWSGFKIVASYLDCDPVAIIRAGIADRVKSLKAFHSGRARA